MVSIVIYILLEPQLTLFLQVRSLVLLVHHLPPTTIQRLSRQYLKLSMLDRRIFANTVEELDTMLTHAPFVFLTSSHPVLVAR